MKSITVSYYSSAAPVVCKIDCLVIWVDADDVFSSSDLNTFTLNITFSLSQEMN